MRLDRRNTHRGPSQSRENPTGGTRWRGTAKDDAIRSYTTSPVENKAYWGQLLATEEARVLAHALCALRITDHLFSYH